MPIYKDVIIDQHGEELYVRGGASGSSICLESCKRTIDWYLNQGYFVHNGVLMENCSYNERYKPNYKRSYPR